MNNTILKTAARNATLTGLYIALLVTCIFNAEKILGPDDPDTVLLPILMLSLFVFSAALTGSLVFGQPILWYIDGRKKEAVSLIIHTLAVLFGFVLLLAFILYVSIQ